MGGIGAVGHAVDERGVGGAQREPIAAGVAEGRPEVAKEGAVVARDDEAARAVERGVVGGQRGITVHAVIDYEKRAGGDVGPEGVLGERERRGGGGVGQGPTSCVGVLEEEDLDPLLAAAGALAELVDDGRAREGGGAAIERQLGVVGVGGAGGGDEDGATIQKAGLGEERGSGAAGVGRSNAATHMAAGAGGVSGERGGGGAGDVGEGDVVGRALPLVGEGEHVAIGIGGDEAGDGERIFREQLGGSESGGGDDGAAIERGGGGAVDGESGGGEGAGGAGVEVGDAQGPDALGGLTPVADGHEGPVGVVVAGVGVFLGEAADRALRGGEGDDEVAAARVGDIGRDGDVFGAEVGVVGEVEGGLGAGGAVVGDGLGEGSAG